MRLIDSSIFSLMFSLARLVLVITVAFAPTFVYGALLEEVVVTAQKREQSVYDAGVSITTWTGAHVEQLGHPDAARVAAPAASVDASAGGSGQNQQFVRRGAPYVEDARDTPRAGKVQLDWKPNDDLLLYASVNRGVKAGAFQAPLPLTGPLLPADDSGYDEEELPAFEGGFKALLMGGRARVSGIEGNANVPYLADDNKWRFTLFVNNIANARNETIKFDLATLCGCNEAAYIKPRWFGAILHYNF